MKWNRILLLCISLGLPSISSAGAFAPNDVWIFGDSYSDTGNFFLSSGGTVPSPLLGFPGGRWSNGPMWVEHLAAGLGLPPLVPGFNTTTVPPGGTNLAVGGALTDTTNVFGAAAAGSGMRSQVDGFLTSYNPFIPPGQNEGSLFVLLGGANDIINWTAAGGTQTLEDAAGDVISNIDGLVRDLQGAGAQTFLMPNLPGVSVADDWALPPATTHAFATELNPQLAILIDDLRTDLGVTIIEVDFFGLFQDLLVNPNDGITNVTAPCLDLDAGLGFEAVCGNPSEYLMYDALHPTAATHAAMGEAALAAIVPLPAALPLMALAIAGLGFLQRRKTA